MKHVIFLIGLFLIISCENFDKAEMSDCLEGVEPKTEITEEQDEEMSDEDIVHEYVEYEKKVILIEQNSDFISFFLQMSFVCKGYDHGYVIKSDKTDDTQLLLKTTSRDLWPNESVSCICTKRMTVEYSSKTQDLTKIKKIKLEYGDSHLIFEFE